MNSVGLVGGQPPKHQAFVHTMPTTVVVRVYCTTTGLTAPAAVAAEKHNIDRGYRERLRVLSDGLASTQLQLATLKSNRSKLAALEVEAR